MPLPVCVLLVDPSLGIVKYSQIKLSKGQQHQLVTLQELIMKSHIRFLRTLQSKSQTLTVKLS